MNFHVNIKELSPTAQEEILLVLDQLKIYQENGNQAESNKAKEMLADLLNLYGIHEESRNYYIALKDSLPAFVDKQRLLRKIAASYTAQRQHLKAQPVAEEALAMLQETGKKEANIPELFETLLVCAFANYFINNGKRLQELIKEMKLHFSSIANQSLKLRFYFIILQDILLRFRYYMLPEETITHAEFYLHLAQETNNWNTVGSAHSMSGFVHIWREELELAHKHFEKAFELLQDRNLEFVLTNQVYKTVSYRMQNNISMTEKWALTSIETAKKTNNELYLAVSYGNLAWVNAKRNNWLYTEDYARRAISVPLSYRFPLVYLCIFPLLECLYVNEKYEEAGKYCYLLRHPYLKRLPDTVNKKIEDMNCAWSCNTKEDIKASLEALITEAQLTNYF